MAVKPWLISTFMTNVEDLLKASLVLDSAVGFQQVTEYLILHDKPPFIKMKGEAPEEYREALRK